MNSNVRNAIVQIENENLKNLVKEVKETLATNLNTDTSASGQKSFGIVDLWNRQRNMRTATLLRKY
jgi:hypothetical protein